MDEKLTRDLAAIQDYTVTAGRHFMVTAPSGGFSSTLTSHNIFHKNYTVTSFNYFDDFEPEPGKIDNKRKMIIGANHHFLRTTRKSQNSKKRESFDCNRVECKSLF